ncbi:src like adaptor 1a isoform X2 [Erpetoichthys calabaricus]|uniref:src like adaptor 1a isoform X2 n=1 Tax=Erpetoichthys calabaricus TaxID=27687 RepID=UPI0010A06347|nr:src like adaptor 1a isoform X2 [Erpetoichthys calabaricus]
MGNSLKAGGSEADKETRYFDPRLKDTVLVVLHDYPPSNVSEPVFRIGEKLQALSEEGGWWKACSITTGNENYIPTSNVAKIYHGWLFEGVGRHKAEELLQLPNNRVGSFMVRESQSERGQYSLSVRHRTVKHYRILRLPNNWYYISPRLTFQCLEELVNHYSESADGLCCMLTSPCLTPSTGLNQPNVNTVMRQNHLHSENLSRLQWTRDDGVQDDSHLLSFGVRNSIMSYLSLTSDKELTSMNSNHKKKSKSVYGLPQNDDMLFNDDYYSSAHDQL